MATRKLELWAFLVVLGAGGCSGSGNKSDGSDDPSGSAGDSLGMAGDGSGSTTGSGGSTATGGGTTGSGGTTGAGGAISGSGGTPGAGGTAVVGAGGAATGSGGTAAMGTCNNPMMAMGAAGPACQQTATPSAPMIDDMELIHDAQDGQPHGNTDNNIPGHWFASGDGKEGTWIAPATKWNGYYNTKLDPPRGTSQQAMFFGGQGFTGWGVAVGIGIVPVCVDASPYSGVTFFAKSATGSPLTLKFDVGTYDVIPTSGGGGCTGTCTGKYETTVTVPAEWGEIKVPFCSFAASGTQVPLAKNKINGFTFLIAPNTTYQFYIDDISFY